MAIVSTLTPGHGNVLHVGSNSELLEKEITQQSAKLPACMGKTEVPEEFKAFISDGWVSPDGVVFGNDLTRVCCVIKTPGIIS